MFKFHFTDVFAETIKLISIKTDNINQRISFENTELIDRYISENRNVIMFMGHHNNWENLAACPLSSKYNFYSLYKSLSNTIFDMVMIKIRTKFGVKLLESESAAKYILKNRSNASIYTFISDQNPIVRDDNNCFNFLNQKSYFVLGGAKIARAIDAAVVYFSIVKVKKGHYTFKAINIIEKASELSEYQIVSKYIELFQSDIEKQPEGYLWSHKRWKQRSE